MTNSFLAIILTTIFILVAIIFRSVAGLVIVVLYFTILNYLKIKEMQDE